ncbi:MAG: hypothetical protein GX539_15280, partial [Candidatus Cloacimonetes bacterium]|nr:hypothetical protein [Candidatus Cloacimonadota bacterium]
MTARARLIGAVAAVVGATVLGVCAAWPIYAHGWLVITAAIGTTIGCGVALLGARRWGMLPTTVVLAIAFALTVVPAAVPSVFDTLPDGLLRAEIDGIAAIVLGWKQLLTLSLPVGTYQAVLVPAFVVFVTTAFGVTSLALRSPRGAPVAALILVAPVAFGTIFGASAVSAPLRLGWVTVVAPRELALWLAAAVLGGLWVWFTAGAKRRAALRLGRTRGERRAGSGRATRSLIGVVTVVVALGVGLAVAPVLEA